MAMGREWPLGPATHVSESKAKETSASVAEATAQVAPRKSSAGRLLRGLANAVRRAAVTPTPAREVIGVWLDETVGLPRALTILRKGGNLVVQEKYRDNSSGEIAVTETDSTEGRRFDYKYNPGRSHGGYFLINADGDLEEWVRFEPGDLIPPSVKTKGEYGLYCSARKAR